VRHGHDRRVEDARAVRIEDELAARRGIKLRGGINRCGPCPRCGGMDRFSVNLKKQVWNCRGCSTGGDVIALVEHLDGCGFMEAVATLIGQPQAPARERDRAQQPSKNLFHLHGRGRESRKISFIDQHRIARPILQLMGSKLHAELQLRA
jgi:phage/plasmid primase-like uncharacterized protein